MAAALGVWLVHLPALFDKTRFRGAARDCGGLTRAVLPPPPPHAQLRPQRCAQTPADRPWDSRAPASAGRTSCAVVEKVGIQSLNMLWSVIS